jgi:signal transduction histidine kinase
LSNLLSNAAKYGDPETPIDVRVERESARVQITVTNEGPGIAPDEIPRLFSRFARTRSAQAGTAPGLGLGLYICHGIVEAHGGELRVDSIPGEKTHFSFTLPRAPEDERFAWLGVRELHA